VNPAAAAASAAVAGFWGFMFAGCCHYWGMVWYFLPGEQLPVTETYYERLRVMCFLDLRTCLEFERLLPLLVGSVAFSKEQCDTRASYVSAL
jgi:hypothetical protein